MTLMLWFQDGTREEMVIKAPVETSARLNKKGLSHVTVNIERQLIVAGLGGLEVLDSQGKG
tara:strand:+ start:395 stop:577 length:183 start_codon:yes stop_codon:yes gene_type:complete